MNDETPDRVDQIQTALDGIEQRPLAEHVGALSQSLDAIIEELDELARSIPAAR